MLKCSFLYPEKALCSQAGNSAQQQQCDVCAPREGAIRIPVGNVLGTSADLRQRFFFPLLSCSLCFSRIALPVVRTNPTFGFSQRFEKLCRCILNSMDVENEPKVSRGV